MTGLAVFGALDWGGRLQGSLGVFKGMTWSVIAGGQPPVQCLTVGALAAAVLALVRVSRPGGALALVVALAIFQAALSFPSGWPRAVSRPLWWLVVGAGAFAVAVVYDRLAAGGHRIGKCFVAGPLLAGMYVAATPTALLDSPAAHPVLPDLLLNAFLGIIIGDGVALGLELAELLPALRPSRVEGRSASPGAAG